MLQLLYFILMPLVYAVLVTAICKGNVLSIWYYDKKKPLQIGYFFLSLGVYYGIEIYYYLWVKKYTLASMFFETNVNAKNSFWGFLFLSVIFIVIHLVFIGLAEVDFKIPGVHLIVLVILFTIYLVGVKDATIQDTLEIMPYEKEYSKTIKLFAMADGNETNTELNVSGGYRHRVYVSYKSEEDYYIYYKTTKSNGSLAVRKIKYREENCDIFENDAEEPRIEVFTHTRKFYNQTQQYESYIIYVPVGTYTTDFNADMQ